MEQILMSNNTSLTNWAANIQHPNLQMSTVLTITSLLTGIPSIILNAMLIFFMLVQRSSLAISHIFILNLSTLDVIYVALNLVFILSLSWPSAVPVFTQETLSCKLRFIIIRIVDIANFLILSLAIFSCYCSTVKSDIYEKYFTMKNAFLMVTLTYILAITFMIPSMSGSLGDLHYLSNPGICIIIINSYISLRGVVYHVVFITGTQVIIITVIVVCYYRVGTTIRKQLFQTAPEMLSNANKAVNRQIKIASTGIIHIERELALIKTLYLMLWLGLLSHLPGIIYSIITLTSDSKWNLTVKLMLMIIRYTNTIFNPILIIRIYRLRSKAKKNRLPKHGQTKTAVNRRILREHGLL